ncbi:hypothetical protein KY289_001215 [Solanum tuberosum]|nr:hypothetical protein KY289_001215 [Solanum tuberosum]
MQVHLYCLEFSMALVIDHRGELFLEPYLLRVKQVLSKVVKPNLDDPSFQQWERCDDMVTSWILNSLSSDLRDSLQYANNAHELWAELEERYDQTNSCKLYQLQKEINDLVQGTLDVTGYYTKMKKLWEEMSTIDMSSQCNCVYICGGKVKLIKVEQDRRLIHFLMGLNEMYTAIRGNILIMNPLPRMTQDFAILSQEEKQREVKPHNHTALNSTSLNAFASTHNNAGVKGLRTNYSSYKGHTDNSGNLNNTNMIRRNSSTSRSTLFCDFCRRSGHTRERCYKLHGYPPNSKFSKGKSSNSAMANVCSSETDGNQCEEDPELRKQMPLNLSKDQYEQLLNLLGSLQAGHEASNSDSMLSGAVNLADSRASHHITYNKATLTNIKPLPYPFLISLPNNYKVKVTEIGNGPSLKSPLELGRAKNGLYFLCIECHNCGSFPDGTKDPHVTSSHFTPLAKCTNSPVQNIHYSTIKGFSHINKEDCSDFNSSSYSTAKYSSLAVNSDSTYTNDLVCHTRLGHVPFVKTKGISTIPCHFSTKQPFTCTICPMAR